MKRKALGKGAFWGGQQPEGPAGAPVGEKPDGRASPPVVPKRGTGAGMDLGL